MFINSRYMKTLLSLIVLVISTAVAQAQAQKTFDFYVMSLSWSPQFCAIRPEDRQCGRDYGLVLHGLWPQFQKGYPQTCSHKRISKELVRSFNGLYPNERLAFHEWAKHGTCSGLEPRDYLELSQTLKEAFISPPALQNLTQPLRVSADDLRKHIVDSNPTLNNEALAFACADGGRFLQEIYVCYNQRGTAAIACSSEIQRRSRKSCGQVDFLVRNVR